jgi:hypothetical protein
MGEKKPTAKSIYQRSVGFSCAWIFCAAGAGICKR